MCGRFSLFATGNEIKEHFSLANLPELPARYNIAPSEQVLAICKHNDNHYHSHWFKWGLIPSWAKDEKIAYKMINARAETISEKIAFKRAFKSRRCLVIANGFYEWHREDNIKQPYYFKRQDNQLFAMAAIWEYWKRDDDKIIKSCSMITTDANALMKPIHHRMPVILHPDDYSTWLNIESYHANELKSLLAPYPDNDFSSHSVSTRVNSAQYINEDAILPIEQ